MDIDFKTTETIIGDMLQCLWLIPIKQQYELLCPKWGHNRLCLIDVRAWWMTMMLVTDHLIILFSQVRCKGNDVISHYSKLEFQNSS